MLAESDAILIASPECNGGYTPILKNALDWCSRATRAGTPGLTLFANKPVAVVSASPGPLGGAKSQIGIKIVLERLGLILIPQSFSLGLAASAFNEQGKLKDTNVEKLLRAVGESLVGLTSKLHTATV